MSTPPMQNSDRFPRWLKWLLGVTVGLFLLVIACCVGGCMFGRELVGDLIEKFETAEQEQAQSRAAGERIETVDLEFPARLPADVGTADLTDEDVSRYLRVRRAVEPQARKFQDVVDGAIPKHGGAIGVVRGVAGLIEASLDATSARRELLTAAEPALRAEGMGPTDLARLAEIVEWRFLRRPEALFLGLPEDERRRYLQRQLEAQALEAWTSSDAPAGMRINGRDRDQAAKDLARLKEDLAESEALAARNTTLSAATVAALQARRAELEALPPAGLQALAPLTAEPPLISFLQRDGVFVDHRGSVTLPAEDPPEPSAPEAPSAPVLPVP